ncbi:uncharacterized protein [Montipora capricornis]|uniref:uncharacterized protein n=1 Tax=Montipora capricornis TaxID=246305 RepID=UPI0035F1CF1C
MTNAFILLSLKELRFDYCWSEFLKVFSSNGAEMFTHERCFEDHRGVVELQFGEGNFVTLQTQLYSRYSRLNLEFVIVRRSLHSGDLQADFFILSLNQTRPQLYYKDGRASSFLLIVDSSNTSVNVSDVSVFSQYIVQVYLVDVNGDIYKSDSVVVQTDEGACKPQSTLTAKNGTLYSPNYPCSFHGLHYCRWTIEPQLGGSAVKAIWINFNSFEVNGDGPYCRSNNWLRVATGEDAQYNNDTLLCGYIEPFSLIVHGDQAELALQYTNTYRYSNGFSVWYLGLEDPLIDTVLSSWQLLVHNITSSSVSVEWEDFPFSVSITHFMVMFTEEKTNISVLFKVWSLYDRYYFVNKLLKPHRMYEFQLLAFTGGVKNVTYSTEIQTITTGAGAPSRAPTNVRVRNFQPNEILVLWDAVKPQYTNGQIQGYTVHYRDYYYYYYYYYYGDHAKNVTINDPNVFQMVLRGLNGGSSTK